MRVPRAFPQRQWWRGGFGRPAGRLPAHHLRGF
uniref:Uncharacterized protein n=1 Tax=Myoviridae sp. ctuJM17 TaxID=2825200 RepID=A0A8S5PIY6_9CAUD|nr:MAG TPA: hypothetical protein [Myoviridae sp. ctuJM17]